MKALAKRAKMIEDEAKIISEAKRAANAGIGTQLHVDMALNAQNSIMKAVEDVRERYFNLAETNVAQEAKGIWDVMIAQRQDAIREAAAIAAAVRDGERQAQEEAAAAAARDGRDQIQQARDQAGTRTKAEDYLKPEKLTEAKGPLEFDFWQKQFKAWFNSGNFNKLHLREQRSRLEACMDHTTMQTLHTLAPETANIDTCLLILEEDLERRHPIRMRQVEYFGLHKQIDKAAPYAKFSHTLKHHARTAWKTNTISIDHLHALMLIEHCPDPVLQRDLKRMESHDLAEVDKMINHYDRATAEERRKKTEESCNKAGQQRQRQPDRGRGGRNKTCNKCHKRGHTASECLAHIECFYCKKNGHYERECRKKAAETKKKPQGDGKANLTRNEHTDSGSDTDDYGSSNVCKATIEHECKQARLINATPLANLTIQRIDTGTQFKTPATPDTGCTHTMISKDIAIKQGLRKCHTYTDRNLPTMRAANGTKLKISGKLDLNVTAPPRREPTKLKILICDDMQEEMLLAWSDCISLGIIPSKFPEATCKVSKGTDEPAENEGSQIAKLIKEIKEEFADVVNDELSQKPLKGEPMKLHFRDDIEIIPKRVSRARQTPAHLQPHADKALQKLIDQDVVERVEEPTDWVSQGFWLQKDGKKAHERRHEKRMQREMKKMNQELKEEEDEPQEIRVRLVTDYIDLNAVLKRPIHPFPSAADIMRKVPGTARFFAKLDAVHGYFQVEIDPEHSYYTTFLLPSGRYRYKRAPMGLAPSGDVWCQRSDAIIEGMKNAEKLVDDILIWHDTLEGLVKSVKHVLTKCRDIGLTVSAKKFTIARKINFAGYVVGGNEIMPDPERISAIRKFPAPENVKDIRAFLGLVNQLGTFIPDLAHNVTRMRELLKKDTAFTWTPDTQKEFDNVKMLMTKRKLMLKPYNTKWKATLMTDASKLHGLGFALIQTDDKGQQQLVQCGSKALTPAEKGYAVIELEALAIAHAIQKCQYYLKGRDTFEVMTDHKPLLGIFSKPIAEIDNPRLQRIRMKMSSYNFKVTWCMGKLNIIADTLSRYPIFNPDDNNNNGDATHGHMCHRATQMAEIIPGKSFLTAVKDDDDYQKAAKAIEHDDKLHKDHPAQKYKGIRDRISVFEKEETRIMALDGDKLIVPTKFIKNVLTYLHGGHPGYTKMELRARGQFYWHGMRNDIHQHVLNCQPCQEGRPAQQREEIQETAAPTGPMSDIGADLCEYHGNDYLVAVCRFSGWPFVSKMTKTDSSHAIKILTNWFNFLGWPTFLRTDGGPQFRSTEFRKFCTDAQIGLQITSPYNSQANGLAESAVKTMKALIIKCERTKMSLEDEVIHFRTTPRADGVSPAQLMLGRNMRTRDSIITMHSSLIPEGESWRKQAHARSGWLNTKRAQYNEHAQKADHLTEGEHVRVVNKDNSRWDIVAEVIKKNTDRNSYILQTPEGKLLTRNRKFIRRSTEPDKTKKEPKGEHQSQNKPQRRSKRLQEKQHGVARRCQAFIPVRGTISEQQLSSANDSSPTSKGNVVLPLQLGGHNNGSHANNPHHTMLLRDRQPGGMEGMVALDQEEGQAGPPEAKMETPGSHQGRGRRATRTRPTLQVASGPLLTQRPGRRPRQEGLEWRQLPVDGQAVLPARQGGRGRTRNSPARDQTTENQPPGTTARSMGPLSPGSQPAWSPAARRTGRRRTQRRPPGRRPGSNGSSRTRPNDPRAPRRSWHGTTAKGSSGSPARQQLGARTSSPTSRCQPRARTWRRSAIRLPAQTVSAPSSSSRGRESCGQLWGYHHTRTTNRSSAGSPATKMAPRPASSTPGSTGSSWSQWTGQSQPQPLTGPRRRGRILQSPASWTTAAPRRTTPGRGAQLRILHRFRGRQRPSTAQRTRHQEPQRAPSAQNPTPRSRSSRPAWTAWRSPPRKRGSQTPHQSWTGSYRTRRTRTPPRSGPTPTSGRRPTGRSPALPKP